MWSRTQDRETAGTKAQPSLAATGLLQRKCACGGTSGFGGHCTACEAERLAGHANALSTKPARSDRVSSAPAGMPDFSASQQALDQPDHGHAFSQIPVNPSAQPHGTRSPDDVATEEEGGRVEGVPPPTAATTPDGVNLGPTDNTRRGCQSAFYARTSVLRNNASSAVGRQDITFHGANTGQEGGKPCDCGCIVYRHFVKGFWRTGSPTAAKQFSVSSCGHPLTINESTFAEEFTTCIGDNDPDACKWAYADAPGWSSGLSDGMFVQLHYGFMYQIWDACRNISLGLSTRTLDISGSTSPRTIRWSS